MTDNLIFLSENKPYLAQNTAKKINFLPTIYHKKDFFCFIYHIYH
jgi:hypothetical protein